MKNIIISLCLFITSITPLWAKLPTHEFNGALNELTLLVESISNNLEITISNDIVDFPEYQKAYQAFLDKAQISLDNFRKKLLDIKSFITQNLDPKNDNTLEIRKASNHLYTKAIIELISMDGALALPLSNGFSEEKKALQTQTIFLIAMFAVATIGGGVIGGLTYSSTQEDGTEKKYPGLGAFLGSAFGLLGSCLMFMPFVESLGDKASDGYQYETFEGDVISVNDEDDLQEIKEEMAQKLFGDCDSSGCVYMLVDNYQEWFHNILNQLNRTMNLGEGIELKKVALPPLGELFKQLNELADIAARSKPIYLQ